MLTSEIIGGRIKEFREEKKISQQSMVDQLKELGVTISRETLSKIETGNRSISAIELKSICGILEEDVEVLLKEEEEESLITLFRRKNMNEDTMKDIEDIQNMIISFMNQKNISRADVNKKVEPLWR